MTENKQEGMEVVLPMTLEEAEVLSAALVLSRDPRTAALAGRLHKIVLDARRARRERIAP